MADAIRRVQPLIKRACTRTGSTPVLTTKQFKTKKQMTKYYIDNKEYYLWCIANDVIPYH